MNTETKERKTKQVTAGKIGVGAPELRYWETGSGADPVTDVSRRGLIDVTRITIASSCVWSRRPFPSPLSLFSHS